MNLLKTKLTTLTLVVVLVGLLGGTSFGQGKWRDGFKQAFKDAQKITSYQKFIYWASHPKYSNYKQYPKATSKDFGGGKHIYNNVFEEGYNDGQINCHAEIVFITNHNYGTKLDYLRMTKEWVKMQDVDQIIPPGHF